MANSRHHRRGHGRELRGAEARRVDVFGGERQVQLPDRPFAHRNVAHRQHHAIVRQRHPVAADQRRRELSVTREPPATGCVHGHAVDVPIREQRCDYFLGDRVSSTTMGP